MKKDKLFRETPFGGYKRDDVLKYIESLDRAHKEAVEELNDRILELNKSLDEAARRNESLEKELKIKTEFASETEKLKEELEFKNAQIQELLTQSEELSQKTETVVKQCEELAEQIQNRQGFHCEHLQNGICDAVSERANQILAEAEETAKQQISAANEQASEILRKARIDAEAMVAEAQGQTDAIAQQLSAEAHNIIADTVREAKEIIGTAKNERNQILSDSAQSIGKIKGNLSSMQMVVKNIENELKSAKEALSDVSIKKGE